MFDPEITFAPFGASIHASFEGDHVRFDDEETADKIPCDEKALQGPPSHDEFVVVEVGQKLLVYDPLACVDDGLNCVTRGSRARLPLSWLKWLIG